MKLSPKSNLSTNHLLSNPIDTRSIDGWLKDELNKMELPPLLLKLVLDLVEKDHCLIKFPSKPLLLWDGATRKAEVGQKMKYHNYPLEIKSLIDSHNAGKDKVSKISFDRRPNGPAIASFELAGGLRPKRKGSTNGWSIHHLYSGKFPYPSIFEGKDLRAVWDGKHFTQSAGLVAVHPLVDSLFDEIPAFSWYYRYKSYKLFGYDPMGAFSYSRNENGFEIPN